jgi:2-methylcitrate dehydratase PrpD
MPADRQDLTAASADGVTKKLARYLVSARPEDLPAPVRKEAARTFLNWLGCAIGGSSHEAVDIAIEALSPFSGPPQSAVLGRTERLDVLHAALVNGIASHVFDFDDTHLRTVIHPAGPVASALLAFAEYQKVSGADFLNALVLGIETECRIGNAVFPPHYDVGWHITGSTGVFGAAAAIGKLLGLDERRMTWALGLAATQPVGLREMFGTMTKSFHPGRAAQNGLTAALLAASGYKSSDQGIEAKRGWANVTSTKQDWGEIVNGLGESYEILLNTYKPFACGIVIHPIIDGCVQLRNEHGLKAGQIAGIALDGKFSVYHSAAVAIITGQAGEPEYSDEAVRDPETVALRNLVTATIDAAMQSDEARVTITLTGGATLVKHVEHAMGSVARPMTDADLEAKFTGLTKGILPGAQSRTLIDLCWKLESLDDVAAITRAAIPGAAHS